MTTHFPLVSIVTPVYNGEKYLAECIESVLEQSYQNWEYTIVNNCSTDKTLEIALNYASKDDRISLVSNRLFVGVIENHNIALSLISKESKYCKVVSADDWIYPECITKLLAVAERNPTVGIVGSYSINDNAVWWLGLPLDRTVFSGHEVCRLYLLGAIEFFGTPSTVLYRSDLVRSGSPFFPGSNPNADAAACLKCLQASDFGFVHQILSYERIHDERVNAKLRKVNALQGYSLQFLMEYGAIFLTHDEFEHRLQEVLDDYYRFLAVGVFNFRDMKFWHYHKEKLEELGYPFYSIGLMKAVCIKLVDLLLNPKQTLEKMVRRIRTSLPAPYESDTVKQ